MPIPEEKLAIQRKTGSSDVQELVEEVLGLRAQVRALRGPPSGDALIGKHLGCGGVIDDHQEPGESPGGERCTTCGIKGHPLQRITY